MRFIGPTLGLIAGILAAGCSTSFTCDETRTCQRPPDGGPPGPPAAGESGVPDVVVPPGADSGDGAACDGSRTPDVEPCLVDDGRAVFVAARSRGGDGSKTAPFPTIAEGIAAAVTRGVLRVIVCNGTYPESVAITFAAAGIGVFGGFTCPGGSGASWAYEPSERPLVRPEDGTALRVSEANGVTFQDIDFETPFAREAGSSAIAAVVRLSRVAFRRVAIEAGAGAAGDPGTAGKAGKAGAAPTASQDGEAPSCNVLPAVMGGLGSVSTSCETAGGMGGVARLLAGDSGASGFPGDTDNGGTAASIAGASFPGGVGRPGRSGPSGVVGAAAPAAGTFSSQGFTPADGVGGTAGGTGQGGGGGGASRGTGACTGASGGAGGLGGCAGSPGTGGGGGGASVALLSWESSVALIDARLASGPGGGGGAGGLSGAGGGGAAGGKGGLADVSAGVGPGGAGGAGGPGGNGGAGSGGTGGPSFAIVFRGTPVSVEGTTTLDAANGGARGPGGAIAGSPDTGVAPSGGVGASAPVYQME